MTIHTISNEITPFRTNGLPLWLSCHVLNGFLTSPIPPSPTPPPPPSPPPLPAPPFPSAPEWGGRRGEEKSCETRRCGYCSNHCLPRSIGSGGVCHPTTSTTTTTTATTNSSLFDNHTTRGGFVSLSHFGDNLGRTLTFSFFSFFPFQVWGFLW